MDQFCLEPKSHHVPPNEIVADVFFRRMRGSSQCLLIGASDGKVYVLKPTDSTEGSNIAFNESFGSILAGSLGLPVPRWRPVQMTSTFIRESKSRFITERAFDEPRPGLHFGSAFAAGSLDDEVYEIVPERWMERVDNPGFFAGALILDIWAESVDRRQAFFVRRSGRRVVDSLFFNCAQLFGGLNGNKKQENPEMCLYYHRSIYRGAFRSSQVGEWLSQIEEMDKERLKALLGGVPREWRNEALDSNAIALLLKNQRILRQKAKEISEKILS